MKKLPLALMTILTLSISAYFLSCKKETTPPSQLPAVQKIREAISKEWEIADKTLLAIPLTLSQKVKAEFEDFNTDSSILVTCRIRFKDEKVEHLLPYTEVFLGGTKYYFYTMANGKFKLLFHNTAISDFSGGGAVSVKSVEGITISFESMDIK